MFGKNIDCVYISILSFILIYDCLYSSPLVWRRTNPWPKPSSHRVHWSSMRLGCCSKGRIWKCSLLMWPILLVLPRAQDQRSERYVVFAWEVLRCSLWELENVKTIGIFYHSCLFVMSFWWWEIKHLRNIQEYNVVTRLWLGVSEIKLNNSYWVVFLIIMNVQTAM